MALGGALTEAEIVAHLERSRAAQGLPMRVEDPATLARLARIFTTSDVQEVAA